MFYSLLSMSSIIQRISRGLTTGKVKLNVSEKEALLIPEVSQQVYDQMTINLNIDPVDIVDRIHWHHDMPFRHITDLIIKEYKAARNLRPVKIIVLGPPAVGKDIVALHLSKHYDIHYIYVTSLITETIKKLVSGMR